jgi:hypothetical protein
MFITVHIIAATNSFDGMAFAFIYGQPTRKKLFPPQSQPDRPSGWLFFCPIVTVVCEKNVRQFQLDLDGWLHILRTLSLESQTRELSTNSSRKRVRLNRLVPREWAITEMAKALFRRLRHHDFGGSTRAASSSCGKARKSLLR